MKQYHFVATGGGHGKAEWEIHKANCADVLKQVRRRECNHAELVTAESPEAIIQESLDSELSDMGYSQDDFRVFPCCKDAVPGA